MKPLHLAAARRADIDHGHAVVVGVGDEQAFAIGRDGQGVGRASLGRLGKQGRVDRFRHDPAPGVDHRDVIARRAGDEQPVVLGVQRELVGMLAHGDPRRRAQVGRVEHADSAPGPIRDEELVTLTGDGHIIGPGSRPGLT